MGQEGTEKCSSEKNSPVPPKVVVIIAITIVITVSVMALFASIIFAADTFTGNCQSTFMFGPDTACGFAQYYFGFYNLSTNPFIDPLALVGKIHRIIFAH